MEIPKQRVINLSASTCPDMDWTNKHDPNAILYLDFKKPGLSSVIVDLTNTEHVAKNYLKAMSDPSVLLYLTPTVLWRNKTVKYPARI